MPRLHDKEKDDVVPEVLPSENSWFRVRLHNWILKSHKGGGKNQVMQSDAVERLIIEGVVRGGGGRPTHSCLVSPSWMGARGPQRELLGFSATELLAEAESEPGSSGEHVPLWKSPLWRSPTVVG